MDIMGGITPEFWIVIPIVACIPCRWNDFVSSWIVGIEVTEIFVVGFIVENGIDVIGVDGIGIEGLGKKFMLGGRVGGGGNLVVDTAIVDIRSRKGNPVYGGIFKGIEGGGLFDD
ncbi:hypothetical protein L6452_18707 [Arctium lappa]|uniref:Uncharacterized protein n=1 Tax=Arctium lappa TaxID=4217 RepID=A0ACB9C6Y7_ARCLA|nr:hypothetical protein L6452_18707 [Arctium lappa]